jgi:hypothetical protein
MPKNPMYLDKAVLKNGGVLETEDGTDIIAVSSTGAVTKPGKIVFSSTETIAAGGTSTALDLTKFVHDIDSDAGGDIFTLAAGVVGQVTTVVLKTSTGVATVTPATFLGGTSVTLNAAGDSVTFCYGDNGWFVVGGNSYAVI